MPTDLFQANMARFRAATALEAGCDESAFDSHELTVVARPDEARFRRPAHVITFGTGTVITVVPDYLEWARAVTLQKHYDAFAPGKFILPFLAEMERRGASGVARGATLGFLLETVPTPPDLPTGLRIIRTGSEWRTEHLSSGLFANALGDVGEVHAEEYWRWGLALVDAHGDSVAAAGCYDDGDGLLEIGVDVMRSQRGTGLGNVVVSLVSGVIADEGLTATYYCAASNVRSQRTALSVGFVPVLTSTGVRSDGGAGV